MTSIYNNMELVNIGYDLVSGSKIETNSNFWSSSEYVSYGVWYAAFSNDYGLGNGYNKDNNNEVRPVLEF